MDIEGKENKILAVDGDIIAYRTAAVCEDHFEGAVEDILASTLEKIATDTGISNMRIYLSGENNFRYDIGKTRPYKGNRASMKRPRYLNHAKEWLIKEHKAIRVHGYEADDGIATDMTLNGAIHCGIDKDILQVPGLHYNYVKEEWIEISEEEATLKLWRQVLMGDNSDNIPGLPKVGEKTAEKLIFDAATAEADALSVYQEVCEEKMEGTDYEVYFKEQTKLIYMVRDINLFDLITTYVEPDTQGFVSEDDTMQDAPTTGVRL